MNVYELHPLTADSFAETCRSRLSEYYAAGVPAFAQERLELELSYVEKTASVEGFLLYHALSLAADHSGHILHTAGPVTGSLLVFLLGTNYINPLPAHHYCPKCGWFEVSDSVKFGLDLGMRHCPECGAPAMQDGFSISPEMVWSTIGKKDGPAFEYRCSAGFEPFALEVIRAFYRPQNKKVLPLGAIICDGTRMLTQIGTAVLSEGGIIQDYPQFTAYLPNGTPCICGDHYELKKHSIKRIIVTESTMATALQSAQAVSGVFVADMMGCLPGVTVRDITNTGMVTEDECIALQGYELTYYDMACALTLPHNTYTEGCFELNDTLLFQDCPLYSRDDAFDVLISAGFSREEAAKAATLIRVGGGVNKPQKLEEMKIPRSLRETAQHCLYLYPRASGAQRLVSLMLLARYMHHDPAAYFRTLTGK